MVAIASALLVKISDLDSAVTLRLIPVLSSALLDHFLGRLEVWWVNEAAPIARLKRLMRVSRRACDRLLQAQRVQFCLIFAHRLAYQNHDVIIHSLPLGR